MFALAGTRRQLFGGAGLAAAVGMTAMLPRAAAAKAPPGAAEYPVPADPTKEQGRMMGMTADTAALAIRERGALVQSDPVRLLHPDAKRLRHHHSFRPAL